MPRYTVRVRRTHGNFRTIEPTFYELEEPMLAECPVSLIKPASIELVHLVSGIMRANKAAGVTIGPGETPGRILDALNLCHIESEKADAAMNDAVFTS